MEQQQTEQPTIHDLARQIIDHTATIMLDPQWQGMSARVLPIQRLAKQLLLAEPIPLPPAGDDDLAAGLESFIAGGYLRAAAGQIRGATTLLDLLPVEELRGTQALVIISDILNLANETMDRYWRAAKAAEETTGNSDHGHGHRPLDGDGDLIHDCLSEVAA